MVQYTRYGIAKITVIVVLVTVLVWAILNSKRPAKEIAVQ